ncbi:hypothetical protein EJB05_39255, partial [Eragrostis curvula]
MSPPSPAPSGALFRAFASISRRSPGKPAASYPKNRDSEFDSRPYEFLGIVQTIGNMGLRYQIKPASFRPSQKSTSGTRSGLPCQFS